MTFGSLFSGVGGLDLGLERAGLRCAWQVEIDPFCRQILSKHWPNLPRHEDVRTFPPSAPEVWRCDLIVGGFPCQDVSDAGRRIGIDGERSGLWSQFERVIRVLRPNYVLVENVTGLLIRGLGRVLGDLAALGFDAEWEVLSASDLGASHIRERVFVLAYSRQERCFQGEIERRIACQDISTKTLRPISREAWMPGVGRRIGRLGRHLPEFAFNGMVDGLSDRLDRIGALGNAVVPQVAEWIGRRLMTFGSSN
jgi:DNA (cytosine-5)-methyltransferase 1